MVIFWVTQIESKFIVCPHCGRKNGAGCRSRPFNAERSELLQQTIANLLEIQRRRFLLHYEYDYKLCEIGRMEHCAALSVLHIVISKLSDTSLNAFYYTLKTEHYEHTMRPSVSMVRKIVSIFHSLGSYHSSHIIFTIYV